MWKENRAVMAETLFTGQQPLLVSNAQHQCSTPQLDNRRQREFGANKLQAHATHAERGVVDRPTGYHRTSLHDMRKFSEPQAKCAASHIPLLQLERRQQDIQQKQMLVGEAGGLDEKAGAILPWEIRCHPVPSSASCSAGATTRLKKRRPSEGMNFFGGAEGSAGLLHRDQPRSRHRRRRAQHRVDARADGALKGRYEAKGLPQQPSYHSMARQHQRAALLTSSN